MRLPASLLFTATVTIAGWSAPPRGQAGLAPRVVLQAYVDAWNRRDSLALDTLLAPAGVHEDIAWAFRGGRGAAVRGFMRDVIAAEPDYRWQITASFADGPNVAAEWTWTATYTGPSPIGPVTSRRITGRGAAVVRVEGGKITHFTDYYDVASFFPHRAAESTRN
jgi:steroid delta-isomerase-like uncharacterized protein